jgi:pimeloyl-ACP methyl ester carboxylesterase
MTMPCLKRLKFALIAMTALAGSATQARDAAHPATPAATTYHRVRIDGVNIFYREAGPRNAPIILLLHGYPSSSFMFRELIPLLADRYHLVAPDYPGFGYSDAPAPARFAYTFDHLADVTDDFAQALGLRRYALYMQDYGGPVGFRLAVRHPERVTALIVQNANAYDDGVTPQLRQMVLRLWTDHSRAAKAAIMPLFELAATRRQFVEGSPDPTRLSPDGWQMAQWGMERPGNKAIQFLLQANYGSNPEQYPAWHAYFRRYQPPTLVVWGRGDRVFGPTGAAAYGKDLKDFEIHMLDAGHFALETDTPQIAAYIRSFLGRHRIDGR